MLDPNDVNSFGRQLRIQGVEIAHSPSLKYCFLTDFSDKILCKTSFEVVIACVYFFLIKMRECRMAVLRCFKLLENI